MQSDYKEIARLTAQRTNKPEQIYKDISNFVYSSLYNTLRKPKSLIIKLKGVGSWYLSSCFQKTAKIPPKQIERHRTNNVILRGRVILNI